MIVCTRIAGELLWSNWQWFCVILHHVFMAGNKILCLYHASFLFDGRMIGTCDQFPDKMKAALLTILLLIAIATIYAERDGKRVYKELEERRTDYQYRPARLADNIMKKRTDNQYRSARLADYIKKMKKACGSECI